MINETDMYDIEIIGGPAPESPSAAMRTQQWIRTSISHLSRAITEISPELQHTATQLNVLPLVRYEEDRWYGIREDGDIISFRIAHPHGEVLIDDLWTRNALLLNASDNFPELKVLILPAHLAVVLARVVVELDILQSESSSPCVSAWALAGCLQ